MRLVTRMSATLAMSSVVLLGTYGWWLVSRERADLLAAVEREVVFLCTSLRVGVENALRDRQVSDIEEASLRLEGIEVDFDVYVFDPDRAPVVAPTGVAGAALVEGIGDLIASVGQLGQTRAVLFPEARPTKVVVATPLVSDGGEMVGHLVIVRPLDDVYADLARTTRSIAAVVAAFVALSFALTAGIGHARLTRPIEQLTEAMRAVRRGQMSGPVSVDGDRELAALAREFHEMLLDLASAQQRAAEAAEAHREAMRTLQVANRWVTVGQLSAAVAHEIGSPLQVLLGRARAMPDHADDPDHIRRVAAILVREGERITRTVSQLLSWTRQRASLRRPVDSAEVAAEVVALLQVEARRRGVAVSVVAEGAGAAHADRDQLAQVLLNLLTNALAATPRGGRVEVTVAERDGMVEITVRDDGVGMDEVTRARAFEPLFTTRADAGGTGLGLVVVRGIVLDHGGHVSCTSAEGAGATFTVRWPLAEGA